MAKIVEKWNAQDGEDETATRRALGRIQVGLPCAARRRLAV